MEKLSLIKPSKSLVEQIKFYKKEFDISEEVDGTSLLMDFSNIFEWLEQIKLYESADTLPKKEYVIAYQYLLIRDKDFKILGMANLRKNLNDYLFNFGGHIGYSISPSERKKGYGKIILKKTIEEAKKLGMHDLLLTCNDENIGSIKIIEHNSGILENKVFEKDDNNTIRRYWIKNN